MGNKVNQGLFAATDIDREKRLLHMLGRIEDKPAAVKRRVLATMVLLAGDAAVSDLCVEAASILRRTTEGG